MDEITRQEERKTEKAHKHGRRKELSNHIRPVSLTLQHGNRERPAKTPAALQTN